MKKQVKGFGQFVNEAYDDTDYSESLVATIILSRPMSGEFGIVIFNGKKVELVELDTLKATWQSAMDMANSMGAGLLYSPEDEEIITQDMLDKMDQSNEW
jgi:hypothetical protein